MIGFALRDKQMLIYHSFTAVILGLPKHIKDDDVHCEYPVDADDEYVTERGFTPTLPGESTKLSSALALFRAVGILSRVLEEVFPAKTSYDLSLKKLSDLSDELDNWSSSLAPHLRLQFVQDKPSTGTVNSRSPLLSLTYHYIRALIQRPAICASLGSRASSSMIAMSSSCKHMIQIIQLLDERGLSFSFCLNKDEVLVLSGFGLLFQGLNLDQNSKILKDNQNTIFAIVKILEKSDAPCASEFRRVSCSFLPSQPPDPSQDLTPKAKIQSIPRHNSDTSAGAPGNSSPTSSTKKNLKAIASRFTSSGSFKKPSCDVSDHRRATAPSISLHPHGMPSQSMPSFQPSSSQYSPSSIAHSEPTRSPVNMFSRPSSTATGTKSGPPQPQAHIKPKPRQAITNLDYLSFGNEAETQAQLNSTATQPVKTEPGPTDWEKLIGSLDNGQTNIYDACYGGPSVDGLLDMSSMGMQQNNHSAQNLNDLAWNPDLWALSQTDTNTTANSAITASSGHPDSLLSFSTDDRDLNSSNEDFTNPDWTYTNNVNVTSNDAYRGIVMPELGGGDELNLGNSWDSHLNV